MKNFSSTATKIGLISDIHYNLNYDPDSSKNYCTSSNLESYRTNVDPVANLGRYGCDSNTDLIKTMLQRFNEKFGKVDVLLVTGDHAAHSVSAEDDDPTGAEYEAVKNNIKQSFDLLKQYFPDTVILPAIGNNDGRFHDSAIDESNKADYYSFLYDLWFVGFSGNSQLNFDLIKESFFQTGSYRVDITPGLSVLNLNTMYLMIDDYLEHNGEQDQLLQWL